MFSYRQTHYGNNSLIVTQIDRHLVHRESDNEGGKNLCFQGESEGCSVVEYVFLTAHILLSVASLPCTSLCSLACFD